MWKPGKFLVLVGLGGSGGVHKVVDGMMAEPFGIYDRVAIGETKKRHRWSVTHLPTGRCIADSDNGFACVALICRLIERLPGAFDELRTAQGMGDLRTKAEALCREVGELRFGGSGKY